MKLVNQQRRRVLLAVHATKGWSQHSSNILYADTIEWQKSEVRYLSSRVAMLEMSKKWTR